MSRKSRETAAIVALTSAVFAAAQARMGTLARQEAELRGKLEALSTSRRDPSHAPMDDPARLAGADMRWQRWVDGRRSDLNLELAKTLVAKAQARAVLARDFGRHEATKAVHERHKEMARAAMNRRAERDC